MAKSIDWLVDWLSNYFNADKICRKLLFVPMKNGRALQAALSVASHRPASTADGGYDIGDVGVGSRKPSFMMLRLWKLGA